MRARYPTLCSLVVAALPLAASLSVQAQESAADCDVKRYEMGLRFQQRSAEVQALQLQAFNLATLRLDQAVAKAKDPSKLAVVTDLDETVIDNSALLARDLAACHQYDGWDTWLHWEREGQPTLIPGAKAFLEHADRAGVTIRYLSDRADSQKPHTLKTLKALGLPQVSDDSVLLLGPPKVERRELVSRDHEIILLLGDTLHDFDGRFRKTPVVEQRQTVQQESSQWGNKWIVLPNAGYGTWSKESLEPWDKAVKVEVWE